jgi:PAS domain S-box-containing protein
MLEANPALLHRVGLSLEQMQQRSFLDFFAGENLEELKHAFTALVMHGREVRGLEVRAKTAQGEIFTYEVNATPVQEQGQVTTILSVARDVTDRKRAEEVLQEHAQIIDHIHDAVVATDLAGSITTWTKGAERLYGYTTEEMRGTSIARLYPVEDHDLLQHQVIAPLTEQGHHEVEVRARTKAGAHVWVQLSLSLLRNQAGVPYGMIGYAMDISARKQTEEALRRSEQELADFFENATVGLHWVGPDGTILRVNQAELDLLGYTREEYIGHHIAEFHADPPGDCRYAPAAHPWPDAAQLRGAAAV